MRYIDRYEYVVSTYGENKGFDDGVQSLTYSEFDERASKIYARLKKLGIGKEDFVTIFLPRGVDIPACIIGVLKAGAAFTALEDTYPPERVEYINSDVGAKLVIDKDELDDIYMNEEPLSGHEQTDLHDAAYAVYTSGSTGNPKGVLHEYGNIDQTIQAYLRDELCNLGCCAPYYFVAALLDLFIYTTLAGTTYIIPRSMLLNYKEYTEFIHEKRFRSVYMPVSYIRLYKDPSPYLQEISTGGEPVNGLYYEGGRPAIRNVYSMSESGFCVLSFYLDKAYDVAPVGFPELDIKFMLLDEDGNEIEGEGQGEICFENEFVRGYINLPEKTREVFIDGMYHTRDIARRDKDGKYYIVGRVDDMIKISGNRIEPAEIEAKVKELTGLKTVVAKGFDQEFRQFICLYYIKSEAEQLGILKDGGLVFDKERLSKLLPEYMIPTYYVPLEKFPLNQNNKIAKILLAAPDTGDFSASFEAPESEAEEYFCRLFGSVLGSKRVGRNDDFYLIGGDSLKSIQAVAMCDKYKMTVKDLFVLRTPKKLASSLKPCDGNGSLNEKMQEGYRERNYSGMPFMKPLLNNVTADTTVTFKQDVDASRLETALNNVLARLPFFHQHLEVDNGCMFYVRDTEASHVVASEEQTGFVNSPLVMAAGNKVTVKFPHAFTDGFGMQLFVGSLIGEYMSDGTQPQAKPVYNDGHYYDLFTDDYTSFGKSIPDSFKDLSGSYQLDKEDSGKNHIYSTVIDRSALSGLVSDVVSQDKAFSAIGGVASVVVADLVAKAIKKVSTDADSIICRCPVNLRKITDHEESLKNMSLCQCVFKLDPDNKDKSATTKQALEALKPSNLKWQLEKYSRVIAGETPDEEDGKIIDSLFHPTFLLTNVISNNMGELPGDIESFESKVISDIPLLVSMGNDKDRIRITFIQQFEDDSIFEAFKSLI